MVSFQMIDITRGTGYPVPRSKSQRTFIELRLFESKVEYFLWGVKPEPGRAKLQKEFHELLRNLEEHGEEWAPTLLVSATK